MGEPRSLAAQKPEPVSEPVSVSDQATINLD